LNHYNLSASISCIGIQLEVMAKALVANIQWEKSTEGSLSKRPLLPEMNLSVHSKERIALLYEGGTYCSQTSGIGR